MRRDRIDNARLPRSVRPLGRVPAGAHVLSHGDLRAIAKHFAGRDSATLGEELIPHVVHHSMFGAETGRIIPAETLAELGEGDPIAGRRVLRIFLANLRKRPALRAAGGDITQPADPEDSWSDWFAVQQSSSGKVPGQPDYPGIGGLPDMEPFTRKQRQEIRDYLRQEKADGGGAVLDLRRLSPQELRRLRIGGVQHITRDDHADIG